MKIRYPLDRKLNRTKRSIGGLSSMNEERLASRSPLHNFRDFSARSSELETGRRKERRKKKKGKKRANKDRSSEDRSFRGQRSMQICLLTTAAPKYSYLRGANVSVSNRRGSSRFSPTLSTSSSTVKVLDVRTVPLVVKHRIAGFRLLAKANAALALSATRATCSGFRVARDAGGQSLASAPRARPSSSFRTATKKHHFRSLNTCARKRAA